MMSDIDYLSQRMQGIFYQKIISSIGTGTTTRKTEQVILFYVKQRDDGRVAVYRLGPEGLPFGKPKIMSRDDLLAEFQPDPQKSIEYARKEAGLDQAMMKAVARGDKFYKRGETYSAELEYNKVLTLDEEHVRANFGIGLCFIARNETDKAREVFERLVKIDAAFNDEHKHLFNDFGINMRKAGMQIEALAFYARALELAPSDENLHYNMARAAYELGDMKQVGGHLERCLSMRKDHAEGLRFAAHLKRKGKAG